MVHFKGFFQIIWYILTLISCIVFFVFGLRTSKFTFKLHVSVLMWCQTSFNSGMTQLLYSRHLDNRLVPQMKVAFMERLLHRVSYCWQYTFLWHRLHSHNSHTIRADTFGMHASGACGALNGPCACLVLLIKRLDAQYKANAASATHERALAGDDIRTHSSPSLPESVTVFVSYRKRDQLLSWA